MRHAIPTIAICLLAAAIAAAQMSPEQAQKLLEQSRNKSTPAPKQADPAPAADSPAPTGPFDFHALPEGVQRLFQREAPNYLRIGEEVWSIELLIRAQRFAQSSADRREPYLTKDAPLLYRPVEGRRARDLNEILPGKDDVRMITGTVIIAGTDSLILNTTNGLSMVFQLPGDWTYKKGDTLIAPVVRSGDFEYAADGKPKQGPRFVPAPAQRVRPVTPEELARHFAVHRIDRFHRWQPRKVWDRQPKVKTVYDGADSVKPQHHSGRVTPGNYRRTIDGLNRSGSHIGSGRSTPREVVTDPGQYHWEWIPTGTRVPPLNKGFVASE